YKDTQWTYDSQHVTVTIFTIITKTKNRQVVPFHKHAPCLRAHEKGPIGGLLTKLTLLQKLQTVSIVVKQYTPPNGSRSFLANLLINEFYGQRDEKIVLSI
ncbi:hypothetical protein L9F63_021286, partial [Diploptera punctata]